jgi:hypothetical protein
LQLGEGALVDIDLADGMGHLLSRDRLTVYFKKREREKAKALIDAWKSRRRVSLSQSCGFVRSDRMTEMAVG